MKAKLQHAGGTVVVPAEFSGFWCQRCERACPEIPNEAGTPAKCPHCRKWTVVWVPPGGEKSEVSKSEPWVRVQPTAERAKELFGEMRAAVLADGHDGDGSPGVSPHQSDNDGFVE
jgi:hypothetical protein